MNQPAQQQEPPGRTSEMNPRPDHGELEDITDQEWDRTLAVNLSAFFYLAKAALPHMRPGSSMIGTSSVNSDSPTPALLPYDVTKAGIANMTGTGTASGAAASAPTASHPARYGHGGRHRRQAHPVTTPPAAPAPRGRNSLSIVTTFPPVLPGMSNRN